jgi:hypothetical protein
VTFLTSTAEGDVIPQIGRVSKGPLLRVSSKVLYKNLRVFSSYNLKQATSTRPLVLPGTSVEDYQAWVPLLSIVHRCGSPQEDVPINTLEQVAAYADRFRYVGKTIRDVKWVAARLKDTLPEDNCLFPESRFKDNKDDA